MAAVLSCGPDAALSHESAATLWEIRPFRRGAIHVSVPRATFPRRPGIEVHRRSGLDSADVWRRDNIPATSPVMTLVDLATRLSPAQLEAAVNEADKRDLISPPALRLALERVTRRSGVAVLRRFLDDRTFRLTDSELERRFLVLVREVGLPTPQTGRRVNGFKVDFFWPDLGLVVETDGLRYHRTPAQQARDRIRDQAHAAAGLMTLRFIHAQIRYDPEHVKRTLSALTRRLDAPRGQRAAGGRA